MSMRQDLYTIKRTDRLMGMIVPLKTVLTMKWNPAKEKPPRRSLTTPPNLIYYFGIRPLLKIM
ncbi:hypothetical protein BC941DRAFT_425200 [Chlamydoabsidia padenii]|nr:hypothetical protein BC941DRAFT_425200 [Chlamydoabsidia padenii]